MDITQDSGSCDGGSIPSGDVNRKDGLRKVVKSVDRTRFLNDTIV